MHLEVHDTAVPDAVPATIRAIEDQGSWKIIILALNGHFGQTIRAKISSERAMTSGEVFLRFPQHLTRMFSDERLIE